MAAHERPKQPPTHVRADALLRLLKAVDARAEASLLGLQIFRLKDGGTISLIDPHQYNQHGQGLYHYDYVLSWLAHLMTRLDGKLPDANGHPVLNLILGNKKPPN